MPVGTSDGRSFNDEFEYAVSAIQNTATSPGSVKEGFTNDHPDQTWDKNVYSDEHDWIMHNPQGYPNFKGMGLNMEAVNKLPIPSNIEDRRIFDPTTVDESPTSVQAKMKSGPEIPITTPQENLSALPRFTVTPELAAKPMDEPFKNEQERRGVFNALTGADGKDRYQTWPEKAVRELVHSFALPGDVFSGETKLPSKAGMPGSAEATGPEGKALGRVAELAAALIFGPAPVAAKIVDGTLGSIAGISAKTADQGLLNSAKAWERMGYPADQIFEHSGWFRGFDKQWKHELPSENAKIIPQPKKQAESGEYSTTLGKVLDFPELYKAYPQLKNLDFTVTKLKDNLGSFHPDLNLIQLDPTKHESVSAILDTVLHEVQHWIQNKEGFDPGSNPQAAVVNLVHALNDKLKHAETPADIAKIQDLIKRNLQKSKEIGEEIYTGSPGEREARLVEIRRLMENKDRIAPTTHQQHLDKKIPESYEVRMPWEKPPMTLD